MIMEFVTFTRPDGFSDADLLADAQSTVAHWQSNGALIRKHFVTDGAKVMGVYIWPDRAAAEEAHNAEWRARFVERTGVEPTFEIFDLFMEIDNVASEVREFPIV